MTSITNSAINVIVQNPYSDSWLKIIIPAIISAILAGFIGYWVAKKREKLILKQKLETETVDELLKLIWITENDLNKIHTSDYLLNFSSYNEKLKKYDELISSDEPEDIEIQQYILNATKSTIDKYIDKLISDTLKYHLSALEVIHFIESRKIILFGFKIFVDEIISKHNEQRDQMDLLTEKTYRFYLKNKINKNESLSQLDFDTLKNCFTSIGKIVDSLGTYYHDLEIALQNEIIGKLYKQKVNERNPQDPYFKVLRIDKNNKW